MPPFTSEVTEEELKQPYARLGVTLVDVPYHGFDKGAWQEPKGAVLVKAVIPGYRSGYHKVLGIYTVLRPGDRLIRVGGRIVQSIDDVNKITPYLKPGHDLEVTVMRGHSIFDARALTVDLPGIEHEVVPDDPESIARAARIILSEAGPGLLGVEVKPHQDGVEVTSVSPGSSAAASGIQLGDIIIEAAGRPVRSKPQLTWLIRAHPAGTTVAIKLKRSGNNVNISTTLGKQDHLTLKSHRFTVE